MRYIAESGWLDLDTEREQWSGRTEQSTLGTGPTGMLMAKVLFSTLMETPMKVTGFIRKPTVTEPTQTNLELPTKASGPKIFSTARAWNDGLTAVTTRANTAVARRKALVAMFGQTSLSTEESGSRTRSLVSESTSGKMAASTTDSGSKTTCTALAFTIGQTAGPSTVSSKTTRKKASASITGKTADATRAGGPKESNMGLASTSFLLNELRSMDSGKTVSVQSGSISRQRS